LDVLHDRGLWHIKTTLKDMWLQCAAMPLMPPGTVNVATELLQITPYLLSKNLPRKNSDKEMT